MTTGDQGAASAVPAPHFRTDDLALASALHAEDFALKSVEAVGRKAFFVFCWSEDIDDFVADFHDGQLAVEPRSLLQAARHCRNKMFSALDGNKARSRTDRRNGQ